MEFLRDIQRVVKEIIEDALGSGELADQAQLMDAVARRATFMRPTAAGIGIVGTGLVQLRNGDGHLIHLAPFGNLITQVGDEYYGERAAGIASPPAQVSSMQLGTGGETAAAKTGAGAAIVTYISGSVKAIDGGFPTSALQGSSRRIQWETTWAAGEATASGIDEWVLVNDPTDAAATAAETISRATDTGSPVNKGASDTLTITWNHDLLGA